MPQCVFKNCGNNPQKPNVPEGLSFFRFPNDPFSCAEWASIVAKERGEAFKPSKNSTICSIHFNKSDIITNLRRRRLQKTALPTLQESAAPQNENRLTLSPKPIEPSPTSANADDDGQIKEGFYCNVCSVEIRSLRYVCVECPDFDLCGSCSAQEAHVEHYVLRVPAARATNEITTVLSKIREELLRIIELEIKDEIKEEPVGDPLEDEAALSERDEALLSERDEPLLIERHSAAAGGRARGDKVNEPAVPLKVTTIRRKGKRKNPVKYSAYEKRCARFSKTVNTKTGLTQETPDDEGGREAAWSVFEHKSATDSSTPDESRAAWSTQGTRGPAPGQPPPAVFDVGRHGLEDSFIKFESEFL